MQDFQTLHGAHLLVSDEILETQLTKLVSAPRVKGAQNLAFLHPSNFFTYVG